MKKIRFTFFLSLVSILLLFAACKRDKPKNVQPIDCENYNDVHTVAWNAAHSCSETIDIQCDTIKICGLLTGYSLHSGSLNLKDLDKNINATVTVRINREIEKEIYEELYAPNWPKKCFAKGRLIFNYIHTNNCRVEPMVVVFDANDIYFE